MLYLIIFALLGLAAGRLRAFELRYAFDSVTGLPAWGHPFTLALLSLSGLAVLLALMFSLGGLPARYAPQPKETAMRRMLQAAVVNSFLLGISAALGFWGLGRSFSLTQLVLAPMALIAAITLLLAMRALSRGEAGPQGGLYATLPIFWACFWLMLFFKDHAADPVLLNYAYELFSVVFLILALYTAAGAFFGTHGRRRLLFFSLVGIYFNLLCLWAPLFQFLQFTELSYLASLNWADMTRHLFAVLHLCLLYWLARHHKTIFTRAA